ncbi:MAG: sialate O-acetylesterase [Planctomycetia bacterium]|nr:sialate O-acetylesterase [Planctomycetia bacterium]
MSRTTRWKLCVLLVALLPAFLSETARAEVELDGLFSPGGVLQRDVKVPIFGTADDGDTITIAIQKFNVSTVAKDGKWSVEVGPLEAGGPYTMSLSGTSSLNVKNVFVGDVWVCAGESNMQSTVQNSSDFSAAILSRKNRELHFFNVKRSGSETPRQSNATRWSEGGAASVGAFSAVGYYFGRDIQAATKVPIGLIACNHFASSAEAWTTRESILAEPKLQRLVEDAPPGRLDSQTPGRLFNGMLSPISRYPIRGVIFYQGETNVERAEDYRLLFPLLIADWRKAWNNPDLPFLFVQITGFKPGSFKPNESKMAELRDAQLATWQQTPNTAMIVSTDFGDAYSSVPRVKEPIGKRLAFAARALVYGEKIGYSGPVFKDATLRKNVATLTFDHVGDGLLAKEGKEGKLTGFSIAGADKEFVAAEAEVVENKVVVKNPEVKAPKFVRYNWTDFPIGNLCNKDGFPASPFRVTLGEPEPEPVVVEEKKPEDKSPEEKKPAEKPDEKKPE